jgi:hypothetical protein
MYKYIVTHEDWEQQKKKKKERLKKKENELKETPVEREKNTQSVFVTERQTGGEKQESNREKDREKYG